MSARRSRVSSRKSCELLGGVALRDTRLDDGICVLADELVTNYRVDNRGPTPILTIPARHKTTAMTLAKTVCVGFPEWTIWALPLTAHEFWYAVGRDVILGKDVEHRRHPRGRRDAAVHS